MRGALEYMGCLFLTLTGGRGRRMVLSPVAFLNRPLSRRWAALLFLFLFFFAAVVCGRRIGSMPGRSAWRANSINDVCSDARAPPPLPGCIGSSARGVGRAVSHMPNPSEKSRRVLYVSMAIRSDREAASPQITIEFALRTKPYKPTPR
jgi:hypothetical protein